MRHLITSALPYINGVKHLGNLVGSMLPADVHARHLRAKGEDVLFICATDEHGTPAELAAAAAGQPIDRYCNEQHAIQASLGERFGLSWDYFGRSSSAQNRALTQHFAARLETNGFLEERVTEQMYSASEGRFLPDRYVIGICPHCGYERARGDQCESCSTLLDPDDLVTPRSAISGASDLELRPSRHLFLLQSKLAPRLRAWLSSKDRWPSLSKSIALKWLDEGLEDRGITRDLRWGVPVERPGFEDKVFYVWFDAPIEYIGATQEWSDAHGLGDRWRDWWFDAEDVRYVQFMAKDNVPFHTIGFPGTIMGSGEPWKLVDQLKSLNWLTYYGGKFSTSQGVGVFMDEALEILPADVWRYTLIANAPETDDASFTWEGLAQAVNKDLADVLGNFVNRTLTFTARHFDGVVPGEGSDCVDDGLRAELAVLIERYDEQLSGLEYRKSAQSLRSVWALGNSFLERQAPWATVKTDRAAAASTMRAALNLVCLYARLSQPLIPDTSRRMLDALDVGEELRSWPDGVDLDVLERGRPFAVPSVLFAKITGEQVAEWTARFSGSDN